MKTPHIDRSLKLIKEAKNDDDIRKVIAEMGSDAQWCSKVGDECTEYLVACSLKEEKKAKKVAPQRGIWL